MKDQKALEADIWQKFIAQHPELSFTSPDAITNLIQNDKKVYAYIAMQFAISMVKEEYELSKPTEKPKKEEKK